MPFLFFLFLLLECYKTEGGKVIFVDYIYMLKLIHNAFASIDSTFNTRFNNKNDAGSAHSKFLE